MDMAPERRATRGPLLLLVVRLGLVLVTVGLCLHVYLQMNWRDPNVALKTHQGRTVTSNRSRATEESAEASERSVRRRVSYVRTLKKEAKDVHPSLLRQRKVSCLSAGADGATLTDAKGAWAVCLDPQYSLIHRIKRKHCRVYSFGLGADDRSLELSLVRSRCDVHCFDPSLKQPHLQKAQMWFHRLSVDWRDPNPALVAQQQHANTKKLATILNDFGHRQVDVLKADMESAEWKILENLILEGVLASVGQLLLEVHLHWAGFEVPGDEPAVVRYWFSLLRELERANFRLFHVHSDPSKPQVFLHKNVFNASSAYTLSWVNTQWL
ncbi:hypothetical protein WMY93_016402 [Mugilogobius chulae]|uniref:Methyltransferase domain-containing protein n=1 Tax=Mugilogobius chulae TaxID=88201 RepID=A0AAW0NTG7_9GOBI